MRVGALGRGEEARAELSAAIARYRAMDMTFWLPQAEAALGAGGMNRAVPRPSERLSFGIPGVA